MSFDFYKRKQFKLIAVFLVIFVIINGLFYYFFPEFFSSSEKIGQLDRLKGFATIEGIIGAIYTLILFMKRVDNQDKQVKEQQEQTKNQQDQIRQQQKQVKIQSEQLEIQAKQRVDDRFTTAVNLLGNKESSARIGAIYSLYHLAFEDKKYRNQIAQILCTHIQDKTKNKDYQKRHKKSPSNEIQTCINLLFRYFKDKKNISLYGKFGTELDVAVLKTAFLNGANFEYAHCQKANFIEAHCQGANFTLAQCQRANFDSAHCQRADFISAHCQEAYFFNTNCQETYFFNTNCQGTDFMGAHCQGANFRDAHCQGANFSWTHCQGADFKYAQCQGADFRDAHCQGAYFSNTNCQGANFDKAHCQGANFKKANFKGAYAFEAGHHLNLKDRINKDTKLETMLFAGEFDKEEIAAIKEAKQYHNDAWYQRMQEIIKENKGKKPDYTPNEDVKEGSGVLKDSKELQAIIAELEEIKNIPT